MFPADAETVSEGEPGQEEGKLPPHLWGQAVGGRLAGVGTMLMPRICICAGHGDKDANTHVHNAGRHLGTGDRHLKHQG